ncbi:MAG TPA: YhcH/YjgK/YiaL family protein [Verrucomicrobiales bacterium]|nr:YhcH/YjgK/YiaL family protein [Verrucomicrobiales bacterium]HRJ07531.1 YhcH/YjgK/YiaL family protein [Prosthecobacter sp.]HRK13408.1 YhcH/YjgK/YiaL family protein [Prosthecobacter sp.]
MVFDTLPHAALYEGLHPHFAKAFAFLRAVDGTQALGRHDLAGDECFALVQAYDTKPLSEALFEAHRKYIDVQYLHSGCETLLWTPLAAMREETMAYDESKDAALWRLIPESTPLRMSAGHFAIFYPQDAHAPCIEWQRREAVFKVVVKVAVGDIFP